MITTIIALVAAAAGFGLGWLWRGGVEDDRDAIRTGNSGDPTYIKNEGTE